MPEINAVTKIDNNNAYNQSVVKKSEGSKDFTSYLGESKSMNRIFDEAAKKYNVPVELLKSVGKAESNFNANAVSRCGAQGVMQLMPATAKELGVSDSFDPEQNIMGGAKYISTLLKKYDGNTKLALAAYNAGSGNVAKYNGIPPFEETQNYVKKVMGYYGKGDIEIVATKNTEKSTNSPQVKLNPIPTPTPVQRNLSFLLMGSSTSDVGIDDLDSLFTYDDYMKFIDIFLEDITEKSDEDKKEIDQNNHPVTEINYNASVINLMKDQELI